jgi:hypothetical protein
MFRTGLKAAQKSKAASIKLTLAAVGLDAYELLGSCTSSLVHNKERLEASRTDLLEVGAPKRHADGFNRLFVVFLHHQICSPDVPLRANFRAGSD